MVSRDSRDPWRTEQSVSPAEEGRAGQQMKHTHDGQQVTCGIQPSVSNPRRRLTCSRREHSLAPKCLTAVRSSSAHLWGFLQSSALDSTPAWEEPRFF